MAQPKSTDDKRKPPRPASRPPHASDPGEVVVDTDAIVDEGSELSFPASDPPSFMGGAATAGPPAQPPREKPPLDPAPENRNSENTDKDEG